MPTELKDQNPKDAVGIRKAPMSMVPASVLMEVGLAMLEGARKYGRHNYRVSPVRASVYYDAALRHLMAWWEGQDTDPDSGLSHLVKAMACMVVIRDAQRTGMFIDDRPPALSEDWVARMNELAAEIIDKHPNPKAPYVQTDILPDTDGRAEPPSLCEGVIKFSDVPLDAVERVRSILGKIPPCSAHGLIDPDDRE